MEPATIRPQISAAGSGDDTMNCSRSPGGHKTEQLRAFSVSGEINAGLSTGTPDGFRWWDWLLSTQSVTYGDLSPLNT